MIAIRAATYWPSVAMKVSDQVGTVSEGKYADIIAVRGDVLRHIDLLQNVDVVIKHGEGGSEPQRGTKSLFLHTCDSCAVPAEGAATCG